MLVPCDVESEGSFRASLFLLQDAFFVWLCIQRIRFVNCELIIPYYSANPYCTEPVFRYILHWNYWQFPIWILLKIPLVWKKKLVTVSWLVKKNKYDLGYQGYLMLRICLVYIFKYEN